MRIIYHLPNYDLSASRVSTVTAEAAGFDGVEALENTHGPFPPLTVAICKDTSVAHIIPDRQRQGQ